MAEIKSTLEMVMERAARMGSASKDEMRDEEIVQEGMRHAARYLREDGVELGALLAKASPTEQAGLRSGMVRTLLRNILLPREEGQEQLAAKAVQGLLVIGQGDAELANVFAEMQAILGRYREHREQLREQLETHFSQQMGAMEQNLAQQTGMKMKLEPSHHPKFREEWQRLQGELNGQYGKAIDQYKALIEQRLAAA